MQVAIDRKLLIDLEWPNKLSLQCSLLLGFILTPCLCGRALVFFFVEQSCERLVEVVF